MDGSASGCGQGRGGRGDHRLPRHAQPSGGRAAAGAREDRLRLHRRRDQQARHLSDHPAAHVMGPGLPPGLGARRPHREPGRSRGRVRHQVRGRRPGGSGRELRHEGEGRSHLRLQVLHRRRLPRPQRSHRTRVERDRDVVAGPDRVGGRLAGSGRCRRVGAGLRLRNCRRQQAVRDVGDALHGRERAAVPGHDCRLRASRSAASPPPNRSSSTGSRRRGSSSAAAGRSRWAH